MTTEFTRGDIVVGVTSALCFLCLVAWAIWQNGYDTAKAECKPLPKVEFKQMSHKQQVKLVKFENRDKGWIK